jgi:hypothetical protein
MYCIGCIKHVNSAVFLTVLILLHRPHTRIKQKLRNIKHPEHNVQYVEVM